MNFVYKSRLIFPVGKVDVVAIIAYRFSIVGHDKTIFSRISRARRAKPPIFFGCKSEIVYRVKCARRNRRRYCSRRSSCHQRRQKGRLAKSCRSYPCTAILTTIFIRIWRFNRSRYRRNQLHYHLYYLILYQYDVRSSNNLVQ